MNKGLIIKIIISILALFFFCFIGRIAFFYMNENKGISGVKKVLSIKYDVVNCIDKCDGIMAVKNNEVSLYNYNGTRIVTYKTDTDKNGDLKEIPVSVNNKYYITKKNNKYHLKDLKGKTIFSTSDTLSSINKELILVKSSNDYMIMDIKANILYKNIKNINFYIDNKYIQIFKDNKYSLLDKKGNLLLENYIVDKVVKNNLEIEKGFIVIDKKTSKYGYYLFSEKKLVEEFDDYEIIKKIRITKNGKKYYLSSNGKLKEAKTSEKIKKEVRRIKKTTDEIVLYNKNNEKIKTIKKEQFIGDTSFGCVYSDNKKIYVYNYDKDKMYKYKIKKGETTTSTGLVNLEPYQNIFFINNSNNKYVKVINFKAKKIKKIRFSEVSSIKTNNKNKAYIIVKKKDKYGLYLAK